MRRGVTRRIAGYGLTGLLAGLVGCHGFSLRGGGRTVVPNESIENLVPSLTSKSPTDQPMAEVRPSAELAAEQRPPLPKDRYAPSPPAEHLHQVQPGETLFELARRFYGDQRQWRRIYQANQNRIKDPQHIRVGMKLIIP